MKLGGLKLLSCDSGTKYELDGGMVAEHGLLVKVETWKYIEECISNTPPLSLEVSCDRIPSWLRLL